VNVSTVQLRRPGLADDLARVLDQHPRRRWELVVEITESALMLDRERVEDELWRVRALGVGIAIDDFGTGYSSLSQLQDLPATELKIDKSFVHREGAVAASLLAALVALARGLELDVVAEGVETREQLETVRRLGCDRIQGLLLAPPLPAERIVGVPGDEPPSRRARPAP
jgi:EAL domain-containing protein (putative c-di-GMP-specific phosphodiesterase class I)